MGFFDKINNNMIFNALRQFSKQGDCKIFCILQVGTLHITYALHC